MGSHITNINKYPIVIRWINNLIAFEPDMSESMLNKLKDYIDEFNQKIIKEFDGKVMLAKECRGGYVRVTDNLIKNYNSGGEKRKSVKDVNIKLLIHRIEIEGKC